MVGAVGVDDDLDGYYEEDLDYSAKKRGAHWDLLCGQRG